MSDNIPPRRHLPLTDRLALDRTLLANERTLLAYVRTAIMLAVSGITLVKFFAGELSIEVFGFALVVLSLGVAGFGGRRFFQVGRQLKKLQSPQDLE